MKFSEFVGNKETVERLKGQIKDQHSFHAYIFDGAEGIGKGKLAYTVAQALLCKSLENGEPCGKCSACRKVLGGNHGDLHYITTDGSSIKDEQIEDMQSVLWSKPFDGDKTILIIDKADTMTPRAQNRLLKTLEEPGTGVVIILLTEKISEILPTIISRSIVLRLKPAENSEIRDFLIDHVGADAEAAEIAAGYSYGSPGKAIRLMRDEEFKFRRERSIRAATGIIEQKTLTGFMDLIKDDISNKAEALEFMEMMIFWYRDALLVKLNAEIKYIMNQDYMEELTVFTKTINLKKICTIIERLELAKHDVIMNANINYVLKNIFLDY